MTIPPLILNYLIYPFAIEIFAYLAKLKFLILSFSYKTKVS